MEKYFETVQFLQAFNHQIYTFIFLKQGKPTGHLTASLNEIPFNDFQKRNQSGEEIFFMVNEGDGITHPPHKTPRSQKSVINLSACFIDTDEAPFSEVKAFLKAHGLKPHFVVETSRRKYHLYFLLDTSASPHTAIQGLPIPQQIQWKETQLKLAHCNNAQPLCDSSTQDRSRVFRLPGFYHLKNPKAPFLTRIVKQYSHKAYTLDELQSKLLGCPPDSQGTQSSTHPQSTPYSLPTTTVTKGNRHLEMTRFLGHLLQRRVSPDIARLAFYKFAEEHFESAIDFLPQGKRHEEVLKFIEWHNTQTAEKTDEEREEAKKAALTLLSSSPNQEDPFQLSDEFYLDAPGLLGDMTKFIYETALYPSAPIAFAASISLLGLLRSKAQIGPRGGTPNNYLMCLAPSGSGKSHAQTIITNTLSSLALPRLVQNGVRSEKGVIKFLESQNGRGLFIFDEGESFFTGFQNNKLPHYLQAVRTLFLELYSSGLSATKVMGQTGNEKEKPLVLNYPHLSLLAFGVLHTITEAFTEKTIKDGLLQRFLVVTSTGKRVRNEKSSLAKAFPEHILEKLRALTIKGNQVEEKALLDNDPNHRAKRAKVRFAPDAQAAFEAFSDLMDEKINETLSQGGGYPEIFTRAAEQVERLLVASYSAPSLGGDAISYQQYKHMEEFVLSRVRALQSLVGKGFRADSDRFGGAEAELFDRVKRALTEHQAKTGLGLSMSALWEKVSPRPSYRLFQSAINAGVEMSVFKKERVVKKGNRGPSIVVSIS